jgi:hypothetical protein
MMSDDGDELMTSLFCFRGPFFPRLEERKGSVTPGVFDFHTGFEPPECGLGSGESDGAM